MRAANGREFTAFTQSQRPTGPRRAMLAFPGCLDFVATAAALVIRQAMIPGSPPIPHEHVFPRVLSSLPHPAAFPTPFPAHQICSKSVVDAHQLVFGPARRM